MGEAKNKREKLAAMSVTEQAAHLLTREYARQGKLIHLGWMAHVGVLQLSPDDPNYTEMRLTYLAGAEHVFSSMFGSMLDEGKDETPGDIERLDKLYEEVKVIREELKLRHFDAKGRA
ncbi:hypothetical protein EVC30_108 [Rhizobium phage RHph_Y1_11]|nr:hypothetical protein EVC30_108 [Rhizobium phage RHph_Y1_11]